MSSDHVDRWQSIAGIVIEGHRVASGAANDARFPEGTIRPQLPLFAERGLDLTAYHPATVNVSIAPHTFVMVRPRHTFRGIRWTHHVPPEDFSFSPCRLRVAGVTFNGFVYYPHPNTKPDHFQSPSTIEVITVFIPGVTYGSEVIIELNVDEVHIRE